MTPLRTKKPKKVSHRRSLRTVADLLRPLGNSCDEIAQSLQRLGITGRRHDGYNCPIAKYFRTHRYPATSATLPSGLYNSIDGSIHGWWPAAVVNFIFQFDRGAYPELVEKPSRG